jgi:hypothetical protein
MLDLHPRTPLAPGPVLVLARLVGLGLVDVEVALQRHHAGSVALPAVLVNYATQHGLRPS